MSSTRPRKLLDQLRDVLRRKHYSLRTEEAYVYWVKRYILFHNKRHPQEMARPEIEAFLNHLAVTENVAASTQNQAFSALLFLYQHVLNIDIQNVNALRAKKPKRLPVVMTKQECQSVIAALSGTYQLMAKLLYGSGLRLTECLRLRVKDVDFAQNHLVVRAGKGDKDRVTLLPDNLKPEITSHLHRVNLQHQDDLKQGYGQVYLPNALARKYPNADRDWAWQYVFPSRNLSNDPRSNIIRRHHASESGLQKAVRQAAKQVGLTKPVGPHTFRHSFATHLIEGGADLKAVQDMLGHESIITTEIYTHLDTDFLRETIMRYHPRNR